jgi:GNAT superfamily N-acetyltransferase
MTDYTFHTVTPARWPQLETLFGPSGAYSGCWCMFLRASAREFNENCAGGGAANKAGLRRIVKAGGEPGLIALRGAEPVGWVSVSPREDYPRVLRSPVHKPVDDVAGVWSIACFFVAKSERGFGLADRLLEAAVEHARKGGAAVVEAYPNDVGDRRPGAAHMWRGSLDQFARAGFEVVARRKPARPIVRLDLRAPSRRRRQA